MQRTGLDGPQEGQADALRAAQPPSSGAGGHAGASGGCRGVARLPRFDCDENVSMDTELIVTDKAQEPPTRLDDWLVPPLTSPGEVVVVAGTGKALS